MTQPQPPAGTNEAQPVLEYHKPDPERQNPQWFVGGMLLGAATLMGGVPVAVVWAYPSQSIRPFAVVFFAGALLLGGLTLLIRPGRRRQFALGLLAGCLIGAGIEGLCIVAGQR